MSFNGFPSGAPVTPLPQALLRDLTPMMSDPAELLVTLYAIEALSRIRRFPRRLALSDLAMSRPLIESLVAMCPALESAEALSRGLDAATERGTLLHRRSVQDQRWTDWIALNDADGRRAMAMALPAPDPAPGPAPRLALGGSAPLIWADAFGTPMPPILADEVIAAESRHGADTLHAAFAEAAANGVRHWRYVAAILERWEADGQSREGERHGSGSTRSDTGQLESSRYRHLFRS